MRRKTNARSDRRHFTRTAAETKSVNIGAKIMRGGIRF